MANTISTLRMDLIPATSELLRAVIKSDAALGESLGVSVAEGWTEFGKAPFEYMLNVLTSDKNQDGWVNYFPILKSGNQLIGSGGFKGGPNADGWVEIGYEIAPAYRNQGLATEMAMALIDYALTQVDVTGICAHTLAEENASCEVLKKCGFVKTDELEDPDDGKIWRWEWGMSNDK